MLFDGIGSFLLCIGQVSGFKCSKCHSGQTPIVDGWQSQTPILGSFSSSINHDSRWPKNMSNFVSYIEPPNFVLFRNIGPFLHGMGQVSRLKRYNCHSRQTPIVGSWKKLNCIFYLNVNAEKINLIILFCKPIHQVGQKYVRPFFLFQGPQVRYFSGKYAKSLRS